MPARFSTATAMTSTLRVIQFSTSSFCLAASRPVGPSQIRSTPSSLRRLLRAGAAADEVRIALRLRHHRDHRPRVAGVRRRAVRRLARARGGGSRRERTSHTLVPATISEPRDRRAHSTQPDCSSPSMLLLRSIASTRGAHARRCDRSRSWRAAARRSGRRSAPTAAPPGAARSAAPTSANSPSSVPQIVPRPPNTDVPPSTTAVIASSS